ncbi:class I SAM-dependent methyltransferase [Haloimpatiens massiliensis]|uniref:class I SAM-dependent methyltransferase n=1 Tax=Haloimpatiens massiliensis TaxID=1658110 RepID=UPI000C83FAB1|nr:class I SAM-dependent methyltransferase [Haloimpatiens massiliensis]
MYKDLTSILMCPECGEKLNLFIGKEENDEIVEGKLSCHNNHNWIIKDGVIYFGSKEQEMGNNWEEVYKYNDYEEVDKKILEGTPENTKKINNKTIDFIIDKINSDKENKVILDIATGRGMLLTELAKKLSIDAQIICVDLSFNVLKYDRLKLKKINPNLKINYIACDATKLPLKENVIDIAMSFYGIHNMLNKIPEGVMEAKRVLKESKNLLNTAICVKEDSDGYKEAKEWLDSQEIYGAEKFFTEKGFENAHKYAQFKRTNMITIAEDIGQKCKNDILPFEGEWFSVVIAECEK